LVPFTTSEKIAIEDRQRRSQKKIPEEDDQRRSSEKIIREDHQRRSSEKIIREDHQPGSGGADPIVARPRREPSTPRKSPHESRTRWSPPPLLLVVRV
jgi:hypothetical protein